jgi:hypothetical protein
VVAAIAAVLTLTLGVSDVRAGQVDCNLGACGFGSLQFSTGASTFGNPGISGAAATDVYYNSSTSVWSYVYRTAVLSVDDGFGRITVGNNGSTVFFDQSLSWGKIIDHSTPGVLADFTGAFTSPLSFAVQMGTGSYGFDPATEYFAFYAQSLVTPGHAFLNFIDGSVYAVESAAPVSEPGTLMLMAMAAMVGGGWVVGRKRSQVAS